MALSDAELLDLVTQAQEGRKGDPGPKGPVGVGISEIRQPDPLSLVFVLTDGSTKKLALPAPNDGAVGEVGVQGPKGDVGPAGRNGRDGKDALDGKDGKDGLPGAPGLTINTAVVTEEGRLLIELSDNNVINAGYVRGEKGDKGEQGLSGLRGLEGKNGASVLSGGQAPSSDIGQDLDHYIDLSSPDLSFYKKNKGEWLKLTGLKPDITKSGNNMMSVPVGGGSGSGGAGGGGASTTKELNLVRAARVGVPKTIFADCANQFDWNWLAETDLIAVKSYLQQIDARLSALELVSGKTLLYTCEGTTGGAASGSGFFTVNASNPALVTQIQMGAVDKNGELPQTPVDGDTLLFIDAAGTGIEQRYIISDASGGLSNLVVTNALTSGDVWAAGVEFETYLFPTNKSAVEVATTAPVAPDIGLIWYEISTKIWYVWDGLAWNPAHLPPSFDARIVTIETETTTNTTNILTNTTDLATKITETDGDARYLQLTGGTVTGEVIAEDQLIINAPRNPGHTTNSFVIKGNLAGVDGEKLLYDQRSSSGSSADSRVLYEGGITENNEITTKKYVDDSVSAASGGTISASFTVVTSGNTWYKLIALRLNNTYECNVKTDNVPDIGSTALTVGVDGNPTRNSFISLGTSVGSGNYEFRISSANTFDIKPLDGGSVAISIVITGDSNGTAASDIISTETVSVTSSAWIETGDINQFRGGGLFATGGTPEIINYNDNVQLANVADPTDGTMVGNRDYNDARYGSSGSGIGGQFPSGAGPTVLTDALAGAQTYRKVIATQTYLGAHGDPPGFGLTFGPLVTDFNFNSQTSNMSVCFQEKTGSGNETTTFAATKSLILSGNYNRESNTIVLMANANNANKVKANQTVFWEFEFMLGCSTAPSSGWVAKVTAFYMTQYGHVLMHWGTYDCPSVSLGDMKDIVLWNQTSYNDWGNWQVVADY
nr:collagen like protein [uncultured Mediterranean phage uvMED]